jgi:hypothetical protein
MKHINLISVSTTVVLAVLGLVDILFPHLPAYPGVRPVMGILVFGGAYYGRQIATARTAPQAPSEVRARITDSVLLAVALMAILGSIWIVSRTLT